MSPLPYINNAFHAFIKREVREGQGEKPTSANGLVLEAWAEGYMVGSLIIMSCITLANMRRGVLLHKLILLELVMGYWQGFFILFNQPIYGWWLSVAAIPLNASWILHNVIAWMKLKPFMTKWWSRFFIGTVCLSIPYWIVEIYANFTYFHKVNDIFLKTRPWEALCRDPWWIGAAVYLMYAIKTKYDLSLSQIVRISPRFAVMLGAMFLSICFIILDVLSVTSSLKSSLPVGINPFWKLSFVFKCLTDSVVLDDFKTALDRLRAFKISRLGSFAIDGGDDRSKHHHASVMNANSWAEPPPKGDRPLPVGNLPAMPPPDGDYIQPVWADKHGHAHHVENEKSDGYAGIERSASRDRDIEENAMVDRFDYGDEPQREASTAHMLRHQDSWLRSSGSSDVEHEYAQAVREMTNGSAGKKGKDIGIAR